MLLTLQYGFLLSFLLGMPDLTHNPNLCRYSDRHEERLDHLRTPYTIERHIGIAYVFSGHAKLVHLVEPELIAAEIVVRWIVSFAPQVAEILHEHKRRIVLPVVNHVRFNNALQRGGATKRVAGSISVDGRLSFGSEWVSRRS